MLLRDFRLEVMFCMAWLRVKGDMYLCFEVDIDVYYGYVVSLLYSGLKFS